MKFIRKMPSSDEIKAMMSLSADLQKLRAKRDEEIKAVLRGDDDRFLLVIGPCSADNEDSVCEYIGRLAALSEKVEDELILIPRIYTNKPRTTGEGYKGMVHQPDPDSQPNLLEGLKAIRHLHIRALEEYGLPAADEMLYPENFTYLDDLLVYHTIGARSVENQLHRLTVSGIKSPVGMKNPTGGDLNVMLNSIRASQMAHNFIYKGWEVETSGNPYAHAVLRGAFDSYGKHIPNYHYETLIEVSAEYLSQSLSNPAIVVDANHSNSRKRFYEQPRIVREVLDSRRNDSTLRKIVKGIMVESYLVEGSQAVGESIYGKSITDPCLGWEDTERLVYFVAENK